MKRLKVELAKKEEINTVIKLIRNRAKWIAEMGIEQWEDTETRHTEEYFIFQVNKKQMYICKLQNKILGSFCLQEKSDFWKDDDALYLDSFVSDLNNSGYGSFMIKEMHKICKIAGKKYLRFDCRLDNYGLVNYYKKHGFEVVKETTYPNGKLAALMQIEV